MVSEKPLQQEYKDNCLKGTLILQGCSLQNIVSFRFVPPLSVVVGAQERSLVKSTSKAVSTTQP